MIKEALAKEWHHTKNEGLEPKDVSPGSGKKVWWKCEKGHEWAAQIYNRSNGQGCPYCSGQRVSKERSLANTFSELVKEWHSTKNIGITPYDVMPGSGRKVWWICEEGHEWEAQISNRTKGNKCPYCSGKKANDDNSLFSQKPMLAKEWHPKRNGGKTPNIVLPSSNKKVWWLCQKGHEWEATISSRTNGSGCPYCSGRKATAESCLAIVVPELAKEWHTTKNNKLTPYDVTPSASKKVWWICKKGHEWKATINSRKNGNNCPYCSGYKTNNENCLATFFPSLIKEWHPIKNKKTPNDYTPSSNKSVWWICSRGHEWETLIYNRTRSQTNCPYCSGRKATQDNCLASLFPSLVKEWHPTKNKQITAYDVLPGSGEKIWWVCDKGHEWKTSVNMRAKRGTGCPYCSGNKLCDDNSLAALDRKLSREWHPTKNKEYTPLDFQPSSTAKVWWKCDKKHEWEARIDARHYGSGCPYCSGKRAAIDNCLATLYPQLLEEWDFEKNKKLTPYNVTIGNGKKVWWKCKNGHKWEAIIHHRTTKGSGCPYCSGRKASIENCLATTHPELLKEWNFKKNDTITPYEITGGSEQRVWWVCKKEHEWDAVVNNRTNGSGCPYCSGKIATLENCLASRHPELIKEWHPLKNLGFGYTPYDLTSGSHKKAWWRCKNGHEWLTSIVARTSGSNCPKCFNSTSFPEQALYFYIKQLFPNVANRRKFEIENKKIEADIFIPELNLIVEYDGVYFHKDKFTMDKVKVETLRNNGYEIINLRETGLKPVNHLEIEVGLGKLDLELSIEKLIKLITLEFNQSNNVDIDIDINRDRIQILNSYVFLEKLNSLEEMFTEISREWNYSKNDGLSPGNFSKGSRHKVWWKCVKGHEWKTSITSRTRGSGCPYCARIKRKNKYM